MRVLKYNVENKALKHENKVDENKVLYCKALRCETIKKKKKLFSFMSIVWWRVVRAFSKLSYWSQIKDNKYKRLPNVSDYCAVTASRTRVIFHIPTDEYTSIMN